MDLSKRLKIEGRNVYFDDRLMPPLPPRLQKLLGDLVEMGTLGVNPGGYAGLKRKSVGANYVAAIREWLLEADIPLRIVSTVGTGAPWEKIQCPHCGNVKNIRLKKGRPRGCYVLEPIPARPTRIKRDERNGVLHHEDKGL